MDPFGFLGGWVGPAPLHRPPEIELAAATMVNGVNGVDGDGTGSSSSGSDAATAGQARENKRKRIDDFNFVDGRRAHQTAATTARPALPGRRCFVTVGATAGFRSLLDEVTTPEFLQALARHGYVLLDVQCGPDHAAVQERVASLRDEERHGIEVRSFAYTGEMSDYLIACRGELNVRPAGCVISHGGKLCFHFAMYPSLSSQLTLRPRHRNNRRGIGRRCPIDRRREPDIDGQSPT